MLRPNAAGREFYIPQTSRKVDLVKKILSLFLWGAWQQPARGKHWRWSTMVRNNNHDDNAHSSSSSICLPAGFQGNYFAHTTFAQGNPHEDT
jgi:hypothetical protein